MSSVRHLLAAAVLVLATILALIGCGASKKQTTSATIVLDFTPNAVHAGLYSAVAHGYDRDQGVQLRIEQPSASTDSVKLLLSGRTQFAILDIHDLALARAAGQDIVGVLALVQRPLAAVIAQPGTNNPRDLQGKTVGVTGLASDEAVLRSVLIGAHADPKRVRRVNIGFDAVPSLLSRRVDAATAFWDVEGVALNHARPGIREFRVDEYGAPAYPELVVCVARSELQQHSRLVGRVLAAIKRGYALTLSDPSQSIQDLLGGTSGLSRSTLNSQMAVLRGALVGPRGHFGELDETDLRAWSSWESRFGIVAHPPNVTAMFDLRAPLAE